MVYESRSLGRVFATASSGSWVDVRSWGVKVPVYLGNWLCVPGIVPT